MTQEDIKKPEYNQETKPTHNDTKIDDPWYFTHI